MDIFENKLLSEIGNYVCLLQELPLADEILTPVFFVLVVVWRLTATSP